MSRDEAPPPPTPKKELNDYEKGLIWKMYEIFRGPDEKARLAKVAELTEWDLDTVKKVVAEGPRIWVKTPPIIKAVPRAKVRFAQEILREREVIEELDLSTLPLEALERLKKEIDKELRRRGYSS